MKRLLKLPHRLRRAGRSTVTLLFMLSYLVSVVGMPVPAVTYGEGEDAPVTSVQVCGCCSEGQCCGEKCCCCSMPAPTDTEPSLAPAKPAKIAVKWVLAFRARECRGLDTEWVATGAALPPPARVGWSYEWSGAGIVESLSHVAVHLDSLPQEPPPRG